VLDEVVEHPVGLVRRRGRGSRETITLEKRPWRVPEEILVDGPDARALIHYGGETLQWQVTE